MPRRAAVGLRGPRRYGQPEHPVGTKPATQLHGQVVQQPGQPGDVIPGISHDQDVRVAGLVVAGVGEPADQLAQLAGGDLGRVVVGTRTHGVQWRRPRRASRLQRGDEGVGPPRDELGVALPPAVGVAEQPLRAGRRVRPQPRADVHPEHQPAIGRVRQRQTGQRPAQPADLHLAIGPEFRLADPASWPQPAVTTSTDTTRYGRAVATSWDRLHPRLTRRAAWEEHVGQLPILEGTLLRLVVDRLPGDRSPKPLWLWCSATGATPPDVDRWWRAFLRRFDLEHTFRLFKQTLGCTAPRLRSPAAADRWTWLVLAAYTQLRLARHLVSDLRRPWERPARPGRLTPARVRRGFRNIRPKTAQPASAPKPSRPGPGRPAGSPNRRRALHQPAGKIKERSTAAQPERQAS